MRMQKTCFLVARAGCCSSLACALILLSGCGGSTASVSGTVTYEGAPAGKGYITFQPADGKGQSAGAEIRDGKYSATGLTPGKKVVNIEAVKTVQFAKSTEEMAKAAASGAAAQPE